MNRSELHKALHALANKKVAQSSQRFFKTGPGEYGEGDQFLGIKVPNLHALSKKALGLRIEEVEEFLHSPWHEERLLALLIWRRQYEKNADPLLVEAYLRNMKWINNWDLVDSSAPYILGAHLLREPKKRKQLQTLVKSKVLWERRIAILSTFTFIRANQMEPTLALAEVLLHDSHDLMHKAVGWMLRELGKRDLAAERAFLDKHASDMPRTMLRYAIERFPETERKHYLQ